ncbi:MAG: PAS domain-containing protein, partial [Eubacteriaceae bacterium]
MDTQIRGFSNFESTFATTSHTEQRSVPPFIKDEWYKYIIHNATEGFFITDLKSRFLDVNDAFCNMSGYSREELLQMTVYDIDIEWDGYQKNIALQQKMKNGLNKIIQTSQNISLKDSGQFVEVKHRRKDGQIIDIAVSVRYIDVMGGILFHFNRDITQQKHVETLLKFSDAALKAIREGIVVTDLEFNVLSWNEGSERVYGIKTSEAIGKKFFDIIEVLYPSKREIDNHYNNVFKCGYSHSENLIRTSSVTIWVDVSTHLIQNEKGQNQAILSIISDINERK